MTRRRIVVVIGLLTALATTRAAPATSAPDPGSEPTTIEQRAPEQPNEQPSASAQPMAPDRRPSLGYRIKQWLLPAAVVLMAMALFVFLATSALFATTRWAWFIYLFQLPFLIWMPGIAFHPAVGWVLFAAWLIAFPVIRRWLHSTPSGERWRRRMHEFLDRFGRGDPSSTSWRFPSSSGSRSSAGHRRSGESSSSLSAGGGRFGGGGSSGRW